MRHNAIGKNGCATIFVLIIAGLIGCSSDSDDVRGSMGGGVGALSEKDTIVATEYVDRPSGRLTYLKILREDGTREVRVLDENGIDVAGTVNEHGPHHVIGDLLRDVLEAVPNNEPLRVVILLRDDVQDDGGISTFGTAAGSATESLQASVHIENVLATSDDLQFQNDLMDQHRAAVQSTRSSVRHTRFSELSRREGWSVSASDLDSFSDGYGPIVRVMDAGDVARFTEDNADLVGAIDLYQEASDASLASAMVATSANPGALQLPNSKGDGIGVWFTELGCPPQDFFGFSNRPPGGKYTYFSGSDTTHSRMTTSILRAVSPSAWIYCKANGSDVILPNSNEILGNGRSPRVHILSVSAGINGPQYSWLDRIWDDFVYDNGVLAVVGAGNAGNAQVVGGPARALNVLAVGNYNDANNTIASTSSGQNPTNTKNKKPEISAPGENIDAAGFVESGTSLATPHVAGLLADKQQGAEWLRLKPHLLKAHAIASATDPILGGKPVGEGGYDYVSGFASFFNLWWSGSNSDFDTWAASDFDPTSPTLDSIVMIPAGASVRIVLAWLTRGMYTFQYCNGPNPIGLDLDLSVYTGTGTFIAASSHFDDPYEIVNFTAPVNGAYRISIERVSNRDTLAQTQIGVSVNWN